MTEKCIVPTTLTVIVVDTFANRMALIHQNEFRPFIKRTVHIKLTDEQREAIAPRDVGTEGNVVQYEEVFECFLED